MCNTREENAAELAREATLPVVNITRAELIDKLVDYRTDDFDGHDIDEAVRYGRDGYEEYTNEELEQQALDYMMDEGGAEVEYHITDADTSKPAGKVNQNLIDALEAIIGVAQWAMDHGGSKDAIEPMITVAHHAITQANQGSH